MPARYIVMIEAMISYNEAMKIIRDAASVRMLDTEKVTLHDAVGRVCAKDVVAGLDIQPFDNAAMDGFAVRLNDLRGATADHPVRLRRVSIIGAGANNQSPSIESGACCHVMTGAKIPPLTEAIIPIEDAIVEGDIIKFAKEPQSGQHIRRRGQDFRMADQVIKRGNRITPAHVLPLATLGVSALQVFKRPKVLFLSTGTEIVDELGVPLEEGQIYNSNRPYARAFLNALGVEWHEQVTIRDDLNQFLDVLKLVNQENFDIVVSSGAVSAGSYDFVKEGLEKHGANIFYHKIKLKPGKPNLLAKLPSGSLYFGLPGNPVATAVGLRFFVAEAVRIMQSMEPEIPFHARAMNKFSKKSGLHMILKGKLEHWEDGTLTAEILDGQESFMVKPFLGMTGWVHLPEEQEVVKSGEIVEMFPFMPSML